MPESADATPLAEKLPSSDEPGPAEREEEIQNYWDYCPNCGHRLHNVGCKYRCTHCHYFMSCSDFD